MGPGCDNSIGAAKARGAGSVRWFRRIRVDLSLDLHFDGVISANLFEAGANSNAIEMLAFGKASRRRGLPTEMVVYPKPGHNFSIPTAISREEPRIRRQLLKILLSSSRKPLSVTDNDDRYRSRIR